MLPALTGPDGVCGISPDRTTARQADLTEEDVYLRSSCRNTALAAAWIDQMYAPLTVSAEQLGNLR